MTVNLRGRRAGQMLGWARSKLAFFDTLPAPYLKAIQATPGGLAIAAKAGKFKNITIDFPDPDMVFIRAYGEGGSSVAPRYVGRAGELFEDAVGVDVSPTGSSLVPYTVYAAPHHIGGGFFTQVMTDNTSVEVFDPRFDTYRNNIGVGVAVISKHPMKRHVPLAVYTEATADPFVIGLPGVCPLGEFSPGVFRFIFHFCPVNSNPIAIRISTDDMDYPSGTVLTLPPPAGGAAYIDHTQDICPVARGEAMYLQVYHSALDGSFLPVSEYTPQVVHLQDWGATYAAKSLGVIDPDYLAVAPSMRAPITGRGTGFVRFAENKIMFTYYNPDVGRQKLFVTDAAGDTYTEITPPLAAGPWAGHSLVTMLLGGPSGLTCIGDNCVMFVTLKTGTYYVWYTLDGGDNWASMPTPAGYSVPVVGPTLIRPYKSTTDKGEFSILGLGVDGVLYIFVTLDLGVTWQFRGTAIAADTYPDARGFNQHVAFVGAYDRPAATLAGYPGLMELPV